MHLSPNDSVEQIAHRVMDALGRSLLQRQALLQAFCGTDLPNYPTMQQAGIVNENGYFLRAGERTKRLQKETVQKARKVLNDIKNESDAARKAIDQETQEGQRLSPYHIFIRKINESSGSYLENVSSTA